MQITMEILGQVLAPIEAVGNGEISFKVNGTTVTLRRLSPEEEAEVQRYVVTKDGDENLDTLEYIERVKLAILSYAIVAVGSMDLRDVVYVETGETLEVEGKGDTPKKAVPVKVPRHVAMRKMLLKWASPARIAVYRQYVDLLNRVEDQAEDLVEFAPSNLDTEIERLESRLTSLKERKEAEKKTLESDMSRLVKTIQREETGPKDDGLNQVEDDLKDSAPEVHAAATSEPATVTQGHRQSAIPHAAKPMGSHHPIHTPAPEPDPVDQTPSSDVQDSFVDTGDSASMNDAIKAENLLILQRRNAVDYGQDIPSVLSAAHSMRRPPHLGAREVTKEITGDSDRGEPPSDELLYTGRTVDGVEAYRMSPIDELTAPHAKAQHQDTTSVPRGTNPRFTPPKKPL